MREYGHYGGGDYYVIPPQGLRNNHLPIEARTIEFHASRIKTIGDYINRKAHRGEKTMEEFF